jgi:hypothetical protein
MRPQNIIEYIVFGFMEVGLPVGRTVGFSEVLRVNITLYVAKQTALSKFFQQPLSPVRFATDANLRVRRCGRWEKPTNNHRPKPNLKLFHRSHLE